MVAAGCARLLATGAWCDGESEMVMSDEVQVREIAGRRFELHPTTRGYYGGRHGVEVDIVEVGGSKWVALTEGVDPAPLEFLSDALILELAEPRRQALVQVMRTYGIVANCDYQREDDYELLYSTTPIGPYVVISGDETYHWISVAADEDAVREIIAEEHVGQYGDEYPRHPRDIVELDTDRSIGFKLKVEVELIC
jgi:hypothetical protein